MNEYVFVRMINGKFTLPNCIWVVNWRDLFENREERIHRRTVNINESYSTEE